MPKQSRIAETGKSFAAGTIISTRDGRPIGFDTLVRELSEARVVYIAESHTNAGHHAVQLRLIESLFRSDPNLTVGMEMFDRTYQTVLDRWSDGQLDEQDFLEATHWYANWKYDFELYADILRLIKAKGIDLIGLNVPFHIPPKIAVGGLDNLSAEDRAHLATVIDTADAAHRSYVAGIFKMHRLRGRENFDYFYAAQCAWDDTMAETVARHSARGKLVVLAGSGHIINGFGIPQRAFRRRPQPFKTVLPVTAGERVRLTAADYIWVTP